MSVFFVQLSLVLHVTCNIQYSFFLNTFYLNYRTVYVTNYYFYYKVILKFLVLLIIFFIHILYTD